MNLSNERLLCGALKAAIFCTAAAFIPYALSEEPKCVCYRVHTGKLKAPARIAFLSDVHSSLYGRGMSELVGLVREFSPDAVALGGDLFDREYGEKNALTLVKKLAARYPCCYSLGNHELRCGEAALIKEEMRLLGVSVLDGKHRDIETRGGILRFIGIDSAKFTDQLDSAIKAVSPDRPSIILDHFPMDFGVLSKAGFDLVLCGHEHGGQWRLPGLINGVYAPGEGLFPKFAGGLYEQNGSKMIVSRGLCRKARDILIPRVFNRPEISLITIS